MIRFVPTICFQKYAPPNTEGCGLNRPADLLAAILQPTNLALKVKRCFSIMVGPVIRLAIPTFKIGHPADEVPDDIELVLLPSRCALRRRIIEHAGPRLRGEGRARRVSHRRRLGPPLAQRFPRMSARGEVAGTVAMKGLDVQNRADCRTRFAQRTPVQQRMKWVNQCFRAQNIFWVQNRQHFDNRRLGATGLPSFECITQRLVAMIYCLPEKCARRT